MKTWFLAILLAASPAVRADGKLTAAQQQELVRKVQQLESEVKALREQSRKSGKPNDAQVRIEMEGKPTVELKREDYGGRTPGSIDSGVGGSLLDSLKGLKEISQEKMGELQEYLKKLQQQRKEMDAFAQELEKSL